MSTYNEILFSGYFLKNQIVLHMAIKVRITLYATALARPMDSDHIVNCPFIDPFQ